MSVLKPKSRLVSFRVSEEEYSGLRTTCVDLGVRSISDFARLAVATAIAERRAGDGDLERKMLKLDESAEQLTREVSRLSRLIEFFFDRSAEAKATSK